MQYLRSYYKTLRCEPLRLNTLKDTKTACLTPKWYNKHPVSPLWDHLIHGSPLAIVGMAFTPLPLCVPPQCRPGEKRKEKTDTTKILELARSETYRPRRIKSGQKLVKQAIAMRTKVLLAPLLYAYFLLSWHFTPASTKMILTFLKTFTVTMLLFLMRYYILPWIFDSLGLTEKLQGLI